MDTNTLLFWGGWAYAGLNLLLFTVFLLTAVSLIKKAFACAPSIQSAFGGHVLSCIAGFAAAAWLVPDAFPAFVYWSVFFPAKLVVALPDSMNNSWAMAIKACLPSEGQVSGQEASPACVAAPGLAILSAWVGAAQNAANVPGRVIFPSLAFAYFAAAWALLGNAFDQFRVGLANQEGDSLIKKLRDFSTTLASEPFKNLMFFLLLGVGTYLSIATIASIPDLQKTDPPAEVSAANLNKELVTLKLSTEVFHQRFPENPFDATVAAALKSTATIRKNPSMPLIVSYHGDLKERWKDLHQFAFDQQDEALNIALQTYQISYLDKLGSKEQVRQFQETSDWYRSVMFQTREQLNECRRHIKQIEEILRGLYLADQSSQSRMSFEPELSPGYGTPLLLQAFRGSGNSCDIPRFGPVPGRPELGTYLGSFGFLARWLIRTESMALCLVTGLIGFGLLGSACSTLVRERAKAAVTGDATSGLIVQDVLGVAVRGCSAAMVVFLAVQGGLATFVQGNHEPSPYTTFLFCLVAAVFSEDVWDWAHQYLTDKFKISGKPQSPPPAGGAPGGGAAKP